MVTQNSVLVLCEDIALKQSISDAILPYFRVLMNEPLHVFDQANSEMPDAIIVVNHCNDKSTETLLANIKAVSNLNDLPIMMICRVNTTDTINYIYSIGADDYLSLPIDPPDLIFRIEALLIKHAKNQQLSQLFEQRISDATRAALAAMRASSDIGTVVGFVQDSFKLSTYKDIAQQLLSVATSLGLEGSIQIRMEDSEVFISSSGTPSLMEKQIIELALGKRRLISTARMTLINYPNLSLLVKNMPIDDVELTGRYRDLLCQLADAAQERVRSIRFESIVIEQSFRATGLVELIKQKSHDNLAHMHHIMNHLFSTVQDSLSFLGLSEEQEAFFLNSIETAMKNLDDLHDNNVVLENHCMRMVNDMQTALTNAGRTAI